MAQKEVICVYVPSVNANRRSVHMFVCDGRCLAFIQQVHHVRSLCLNSSRANRIRQSYKLAGQLRRSRSQCTSKLLLKMHSVASSTDDARTQSSNSSNNSSTGPESTAVVLAGCSLAGGWLVPAISATPA